MATDPGVLLLPADEGGCGFYRMREPARVLREHGLDITIQTEIPVDGWVQPDGSFDVQSVGFDQPVMVLQRPLLKAMPAIIRAVQAQGTAVVVELDDDLAAVHKSNVAFSALDPIQNPQSNWNYLKECCDLADLVTVSTPNLAKRYASHGRFRVLRNCLPAAELDRKKTPPNNLRLGWTGTIQTHPEDLLEAGSQINAALNSSTGDPGFWVVGDGKWVKEALGLSESNTVYATGWVEQSTYLEYVNLHIDVGIVPLTIDTFNTGKSYLKSLEFASQGIPSVVSPTEENILLSEITGNPVAYKKKDWKKHLKPLLSNRDLWLERSHAVREAVRPLTYENHADEWLSAWSQAVEHRRSQRKFGF